MTKCWSGSAFLTDDQYQCLPMAIAGRLPMAPWELPIDPWWCPDRLQGDSFMFSLVV